MSSRVKCNEALAKLFVILEGLYRGYNFSDGRNQIPAQNHCGNDEIATFAAGSHVNAFLKYTTAMTTL
jgi:hypothetical protein